jgi:hypothetical protein
MEAKDMRAEEKETSRKVYEYNIANDNLSSFSKINFFMCKNKGKFIVFEKLDCNSLYYINHRIFKKIKKRIEVINIASYNQVFQQQNSKRFP